jgi:spermidine/putrescine transport system substrate-binding protein
MKKSAYFFLIAGMAMLIVGAGIAAAAETLDLLTWQGYAPKELVDKFEKETGITVKMTYSNNEEMIAKLRATRGAGFDLAQPSQDRISSVQEEFKIYQPIDLSKVEVQQIIPAMLEAVKQNTMVNGKPHAVPFCWGTSGLVVNKSYAPNAKDYSDLLCAFYNGRVSYRLKRPTLIALAFALGENPFAKYSDAAAYEALMERIGQAMMAGKPFVKNYWTNGDALLESMRSGEVHVAMAWDKGGWKLHTENPNIDFIAPRSGALGWIDTFAIPAKAKNVAGAYKWINFMLRPENAAVFTNLDTTLSASAGANEFLEPSIRENFERSFPMADIANIKWYPPVPAKLESIEGKILDKVKAAQ